MHPDLLAIGVLLALGVFAFSNVFEAGFVFDDIARIVEAPSLRALPEALAGSTRP